MEFTDYNWHDSEIINIEIDRANPGKRDTIVFSINWNDNEKGKLIFEDVYWADLKLNFGIIANECIDEAFTIGIEDEDFQNLYKKWNGAINNIKLNTYLIRTISTGSEIKIIAKTFKIV